MYRKITDDLRFNFSKNITFLIQKISFDDQMSGRTFPRPISQSPARIKYFATSILKYFHDTDYRLNPLGRSKLQLQPNNDSTIEKELYSSKLSSKVKQAKRKGQEAFWELWK